MNRGEALGLGPIREDDELLDRLGRREVSTPSPDGLESLLAAWTHDIDHDLPQSAPVPLIGPAREPAAPPARTIRVGGLRGVALVGAGVLTLCGSTVAAAGVLPANNPAARVVTAVSAGFDSFARAVSGSQDDVVASASETEAAVAEARRQLQDARAAAEARGDKAAVQGIDQAARALDAVRTSGPATFAAPLLSINPTTLPSLATQSGPVAPPTTAASADTGAATVTGTGGGTGSGTDSPKPSATGGTDHSAAPSPTPTPSSPTPTDPKDSSNAEHPSGTPTTHTSTTGTPSHPATELAHVDPTAAPGNAGGPQAAGEAGGKVDAGTPGQVAETP